MEKKDEEIAILRSRLNAVDKAKSASPPASPSSPSAAAAEKQTKRTGPPTELLYEAEAEAKRLLRQRDMQIEELLANVDRLQREKQGLEMRAADQAVQIKDLLAELNALREESTVAATMTAQTERMKEVETLRSQLSATQQERDNMSKR